MNYPVAIHKDPGSDYGVTIPDLPGCFSAGSTIDEALVMAKEAIQAYLETLAQDGRELPQPSDIEQRRAEPDYADAIWAIVSVDLNLSQRAA